MTAELLEWTGTKHWTEPNYFAAVADVEEYEEVCARYTNISYEAHLLSGKNPADFDFEAHLKRPLPWGWIKRLESYCEGLPSREAALAESKDIASALKFAKKQAIDRGLHVEFGRLMGEGPRCYAAIMTMPELKQGQAEQDRLLKKGHDQHQKDIASGREQYDPPIPLQNPTAFKPSSGLMLEIISRFPSFTQDKPSRHVALVEALHQFDAKNIISPAMVE